MLVLMLMLMFAALAATMRVSLARLYRGGIFVLIHLRQLSNEGNHVPDVSVLHALAPRRHAGRFDTVLDRPECTRGIEVAGLREVRRPRIQPSAELCLLGAGGQVAADAHRIVVPGTT